MTAIATRNAREYAHEQDALQLIRVRPHADVWTAEVLYDGKVIAIFKRIGNFDRDLPVQAAIEHADRLRRAFVAFHMEREP